MDRIGRREFLTQMGRTGAALACGAAALKRPRCARAADKPATRPAGLNFVFILADDLGWADTACYGSDFYETPHIDALARQGMRFTDAYAACPVCSPTRASILTGRYPARLGLTDWIPGMASGRGQKLLAPPFLQKLPLAEVTVAEALRAAGYATAAVGKWHLGGKGNLPEDQGFDVNVGGTAAGSPAGGYYLPNKMHLPGAKPGDYLTDRLTNEGLKVIERFRDRPFFLYQSYHSVHTPIQAKKAYAAKYQAKAAARGRRVNAAYAGMIQSLDEGVGRIVGKLDELGLAERTVVFFMSDNGGLAGVTSNAPLRAGKGHVYEGGIREPMIVRAPGMVRRGSLCRTPVISVDFLPTILELAGVGADPTHPIDGVSLAGLLKGGPAPKRDAIYWHYPHYSNQGGRPAGAVRQGDLKLLEFYEDNHVELYNLKDDPGEAVSLAEKMPDKAAELLGMLQAWRKSVGARMPTPNPRYDPRAAPRGRAEPASRPAPLPKGDRDGDFDVLTGAAADACDLGYAIRTQGTGGGLALKKLPQPLTRRAVFKLKLKSLQKDTSARAWRNGFLVFGDQPQGGGLIACGLYLGGRRKLAVIEGPPTATGPRKEADLKLDPYTLFEVQVTVDLQARTVELAVGDEKVSMKLSAACAVKSVKYCGYGAVNTTTAFSSVQVKGE